MADFTLKTLPPRNIYGRGLNSSSSKGGRGSKSPKRGRPRKHQQQPSRLATAAAAAEEEEEGSRSSSFPAAGASTGTPTASHAATEQAGQTLEQKQQQRVLSAQQRQCERYGFDWRSNPSSQQLVVLGELPEGWLDGQQQPLAEQGGPELALQAQGSQQQQQQGQAAPALLDSSEVQQQQQQQRQLQLRRQKFKHLKELYAGDKLDWWRIDEAAVLDSAEMMALIDLTEPAEAVIPAEDYAPVAEPESDEEFYEAAAAGSVGAGGLTLQQAPVRRFYRVGFLEPDRQPWAVVEPVALVTRRDLPQLLRCAAACEVDVFCAVRHRLCMHARSWYEVCFMLVKSCSAEASSLLSPAFAHPCDRTFRFTLLLCSLARQEAGASCTIDGLSPGPRLHNPPSHLGHCCSLIMLLQLSNMVVTASCACWSPDTDIT
jgi:hypothetical protein